MDAGVRIDEDTRRSEALQAAPQKGKGKFGELRERGKSARTDNMQELADWGGCAKIDNHNKTLFDWATLATDGTSEHSIVSSVGPMV